MGVVHVDGHYRLGKSGRREWVDGYSYTRAGGSGDSEKAPTGASRVSTPSAALGHARLVQKRQKLTKGEPPTAETPGWTEKNGRPVMDDATYASWLENTIREARGALVSKGDTVKKFKTVANGTAYTAKRKEQQKGVIDAFMEKARKVPKERKMVMTGGRPGAGKSTSLEQQGVTKSNYFILDSDAVKAEMIKQGMAPDIEGLTPFESAGLIHEESSDILDILIERMSMQGTNFVLDGTMAWAPYVKKHADELHEMGYTIKGLFVEVTPETSKRRALARHKQGVEDFLTKGLGYGGRFVDPDISTRASTNRSNFDSLRDLFESWYVYDNEVDGHLPVMTEASHREVRFTSQDDMLTLRNTPATIEEAEYYLQLLEGGGY